MTCYATTKTRQFVIFGQGPLLGKAWYVREEAPVYKHTSLPIASLGMLGVRLGVFTGFWLPPAVQRDVEGGAGIQARHETGQGWQAI